MQFNPIRVFKKFNRPFYLKNVHKKILQNRSSYYIQQTETLFEGQGFNINEDSNAIISAICMKTFCNKGKALTTNKTNVYCILHVTYKKQNFLVSSGDGEFLDIYEVNSFVKDKTIGKSI